MCADVCCGKIITLGVTHRMWSTPYPFWFFRGRASHSLAWNKPSRLGCLACEPQGLLSSFFFFFNVGPRDCLQVEESYSPFEPSPSRPFFLLLDVYCPALPVFKAHMLLHVIFRRQRCSGFCLFVFNFKFFIAFFFF